MEHGEMRLESLGFRARLRRQYNNIKQQYNRRRKRSLFRFGFVFVAGLLNLGLFTCQLLFSEEQTILLGLVLGGTLVGLVYGYFVVRKVVRRTFRGFTDERTIPIRTIESVDPRPKGLFRRPGFILHYDEHGTEKKRYIGVCSLSPLAEDEFEEAKVLFFDEHDLTITKP